MDKSKLIETVKRARDLFADFAGDPNQATAMTSVDRKTSNDAVVVMTGLENDAIDPSAYAFINAYWEHQIEKALAALEAPSESAAIVNGAALDQS